VTPDSISDQLAAELQRVRPICDAHGLSDEQALELAAGTVIVTVKYTQPALVFQAMGFVDQAVSAIRHGGGFPTSRV